MQPFQPEGEQPAHRLRIPSWPSGALKVVGFYSLYDDDGEPLPWMRAGSDIDLEPGVYVIYDGKGRDFYIGSALTNVRRTLARHFQRWQRPAPLSQYVTKYRGEGARMSPQSVSLGGVTFQRQHTSAAVYLIPAQPTKQPRYAPHREGDELQPRQFEAWLYDRLCSRRKCRGDNDLAGVPF